MEKQRKSEAVASQKKRKRKDGCFVTKGIYFVAMCVYMELCFSVLIYHGYTSGMFFGMLEAIAIGLFLAGITNFGIIRTRRIVGWICQTLICILYCVQFVYYQIFKTFLSYSIVVKGGGAEAVGEFKSLLFDAIFQHFFSILLLILPMFAYGAYLYIERTIRSGLFRRMVKEWRYIFLGAAVIVHLLMLCLLPIGGMEGYTPYVLYHKDWVKDLSFEKLGFLASTRLDIFSIFGGNSSPEVSSEAIDMSGLMGNNGENSDGGEEKPSKNEENLGGEEKPPVIEYNKLAIDFAALAAEEDDEDVKWLHEYMNNSTPTKKNQYTGMFEGYNLILITAESFSPWAVDKKVTPTLYKLVNTGFVFENYYVQAFNNTSDGEYMVCTGLLPNGQGVGTFQSTLTNGTAADGKNNMAMCFGNMLGKLGYGTRAYHNHTYTYYKRHLTHPNMGYTYKGYGSGLDVKKTWPESDLEMMQLTMGEYVDNPPFHAYYMSVSGHMNYDFVGNYISYKNKGYVEDLPLSTSMQAYLAAQKELDLALEYVLQTLEEKGQLENTVIAMATDHYPYALEEELTKEVGDEVDWYGLYRSNLILWSASMKEPVHVTKACSSIDIAPTLCNLLGLDYDSRLYTGRDILSDEPGLVIFSNKGFVTDYCIYNTATDKYKATTDTPVTQEYVDAVKEVVNQRWTSAGKIVETDYYSYIEQLK